MLKILMIVLCLFLSICWASRSGLICYVKHAMTEQANTIDLAPDATVGDLAQSIIDLGELNGLALPFVTADELTIEFGGSALQTQTEFLSDLGVGQQALITYRAKEYQIEGSTITLSRALLNLGNQSYRASNVLMRKPLHYTVAIGQTGIFNQIIGETREQLDLPLSVSLNFRFVCNETSEMMIQEMCLILVTRSAQRSCYNSIGPELETRLVKSAMMESFESRHHDHEVLWHPFNDFDDRAEKHVADYHLSIDIGMPEGLTLLIFDRDVQAYDLNFNSSENPCENC